MLEMKIKKIKTNGFYDYILIIESKKDLKRVIKRYNLPLWQVKDFIQLLAENKKIDTFLCIEKKENKFNFFIEY